MSLQIIPKSRPLSREGNIARPTKDQVSLHCQSITKIIEILILLNEKKEKCGLQRYRWTSSSIMMIVPETEETTFTTTITIVLYRLKKTYLGISFVKVEIP